jgi:pyruvate-ferredoxin/flavodoxin oxidoreductase
MVSALKYNGTFLLNCKHGNVEECSEKLPPRMLRQLAEKDTKFYVIDANAIAKKVGMAKRTNTVM